MASLVAIWLIANEIISILENIGDIGVNVPPFLVVFGKVGQGRGRKRPGNRRRNDQDYDRPWTRRI